MIRVFVSVALVGLATMPRSARADPGKAFESADEAAIDAFDYLMKQHSDWKKYEYGGCIYQKDGSFYATEPKTQYQPKVCKPARAPPGSIGIGDYHNHTSLEDYSSWDLDNSGPKYVAYLLTPKGWIKKWSGAIEILRKGAP